MRACARVYGCELPDGRAEKRQFAYECTNDGIGVGGAEWGVHVNMCVECFAHVEEDENSSSHGHIVGTGGNAKSIKHRE